MSYNKRLERVITNIIRGNKADLDKISGSVVRAENKLLLTCKYGTIILNNINGCYEIEDNGPVNSWNSDMLDHISSFKDGHITNDQPLPHVKDRIIIFSDSTISLPDYYKTFTYSTISVERLNELYDKGYRYFITTEENHTDDIIIDWIRSHTEVRFIHLKHREAIVRLPYNSVSFDHRWYMFSMLEKLFPGECYIIRSSSDVIPDDKRVVLGIMSDDEWNKLQYLDGKYYWSVNTTNTHHNGIRCHTGKTTLLEDALWIMDYYITYHHKPESSLIGEYKIINGVRHVNLFDKYVIHDGKEINTYIIDV